jgi:hypothetical protein
MHKNKKLKKIFWCKLLTVREKFKVELNFLYKKEHFLKI